MYEELVESLRVCASDKTARCYNGCHEERIPGCACGIKLMLKAADAIEELSKPRWIPVTEQLPEDGVAVNIVWRNHSPVIYYQHIKDKPQTATGVYYHGRWYWLAEYGEWEHDKIDEAIEVTHWQPLPPLPEPPK